MRLRLSLDVSAFAPFEVSMEILKSAFDYANKSYDNKSHSTSSLTGLLIPTLKRISAGFCVLVLSQESECCSSP